MAGRPKRVFTDNDMVLIEQYAHNNCHNNTIAIALNMPVNTLTRHFGKKLKLWRAQGKIELRQYQRDLAVKYPSMAQFLGKNELNQTDKQVISHEGQVAPVMSESERKALADVAREYKLKLAGGT